MHRFAAFVLALLLACTGFGALAWASSSFPRDFVRVAGRQAAPRCAPQLLASVTGS